jgi:hypothetical protein
MLEKSRTVSCPTSGIAALSAGENQKKEQAELFTKQLPPPGALVYALDSLHAKRNVDVWLGNLPVLIRESFASDHLSISAWLQGIGRPSISLPQVDQHIHELCQADLYSMLRAYLRSNSPDRGREADWFHLRALSFQFSGYAARRALEQEILLRSQEEESWVYHRCRWRYREAQQDQLGPFCNKKDAARHARSGKIFFHPDQLSHEATLGWPVLKQLLDFFKPGFLADLLTGIATQRHIELHIPTGSWALLRPLVAHVFSGHKLPFLELPGGTFQNDLPPCPEGLKGILVLHPLTPHAPAVDIDLDAYERLGWKVILVHGSNTHLLKSVPMLSSTGDSLQKGGENLLSPKNGEVLPLREFVRRMERRYIHDVLGLHAGIKTRACESLAITRQTLYTKLAKQL